MKRLASIYYRFISTVFLGLILSNISEGQQFYNTDPYKINFIYLDIDQTKAEVVTYKIRRIVSKVYEIKRGHLKNEIPKNNFSIVEFNQAGNPVSFHCKSYRATHDPKGEISQTYKYAFEYDTLENLIHIQEQKSHFLSPEQKDEKDVYFFYDKSNLLTDQICSEKRIYTPGYQYGGSIMRNDTSLTKYVFNYDDSNKVIAVFKDQYENYSKKHWLDTLLYKSSFDSLFIEKRIPKGMKKDSAGRMIESTSYSSHVLLKSGNCISPNMPADVITKYYYGKNRKLIESESYSRKGDFIRRRFWKYNDQGLLQSVQTENSKRITIYMYSFY